MTRTLVSTSATKTRSSKLSALADIPVNRICGAGMVKTSGFALAIANQDLANLLRIGGGGDRQRDHRPARPVVAHEIGDDAGHKARVRDDDLGAVKCLDFGRTDIDAAHKTLVAADHDPIANPDRALPEKDQARYEIVDDRLEAETYTNRQRARHKGELFEIQSKIAKREAGRDEKIQIAKTCPDRIPQTQIEIQVRKSLESTHCSTA